MEGIVQLMTLVPYFVIFFVAFYSPHRQNLSGSSTRGGGYRSKIRFKRNIKKILLCSTTIILLISSLIYIISSKFDFLFTKFHHIFFPQGNWQFPASSNLINLFPQTFFYDFFYQIILVSFIISAVIFVIILLPSPTTDKKKV